MPHEPTSTAELHLPLPGLDRADLEAAIRRWRRGGSADEARAARKLRAGRITLRLDYLLRRARTGAHGWTLPRVATVEDRVVADLTPEDAVLVGAITAPFKKHPRLKVMLPDAYAYLGGGGTQKALKAILKAVRGAEGGPLHTAGTDFIGCFAGLSPEKALDQMQQVGGFASWRLGALRQLYRFWHQRPEFRGLVTGPSSSAYLSEFALKGFDEILCRHGQLVRYSDNVTHIRQARGELLWSELLAQAVDEFNATEGLSLQVHKLQQVTYDSTHGFHEAFTALGFMLIGHDVRPDPRKVGRCAQRLAEARTLGEAKACLDGWTRYYSGLVPDGHLYDLAGNLWRNECARRSRTSRDVNRPDSR